MSETRRYTFTGPSAITPAQEQQVREVVRRLNPPPSEVTTGAASGVDTIACLQAIESYPEALHRVIVPAAPHNDELLEFLANIDSEGMALIEIIRMPSVETTDETNRRRLAYRARNREMMPHTDELIAMLRKPTFYRSGEFMTVNIAEDYGVPTITRKLLV